jgi:CBS domain-containing protein
MQDTLEAVLAHKGSTVYSVDPEDSVLDAVRKMNCEHVGAVLVCIDGRMVGIFTERDVLCRVLDAGRDPGATSVADVMTSEVVTVGPKTDVRDAMAVITERRTRHLPVVDGDDLKGVVSIGDLTRWVSRSQEGHIQHLMNFITGKYPG